MVWGICGWGLRVWGLGLGVWCGGSGVWCLLFGVWCLVFGVGVGVWRFGLWGVGVDHPILVLVDLVERIRYPLKGFRVTGVPCL